MILIDGREFDVKQGVVQKPKRQAIPFRNAASDGTGMQVTPARGPVFQLQVTRYVPDTVVMSERNWIDGSNGARVQINEYVGTQYIVYASIFHGRLVFPVINATVIEQDTVSRFCGHRRQSGSINIAPAVKLVSRWTLYAVSLI